MTPLRHLLHPAKSLRGPLLVLGWCLCQSLAGAAPMPGTQKTQRSNPPAPSAKDATNPGRTVTQAHTQQVYWVLLAEFFQNQGNPLQAHVLFLEAAQASGQAELYRRATQAALSARAGDQALEAARQWRIRLGPQPDAVRHEVGILLALRRSEEALDALSLALSGMDVTDRNQVLIALPDYLERGVDTSTIGTWVQNLSQPYIDQPAHAFAARMGRIAAATQAGEFGRAVTWLEEALRLPMPHPDIQIWSHVPSRLLQHPQAPLDQVLPRLLLLYPDQHFLRIQWSHHLMKQLRYSEALQALVPLESQAPETASHWLLKAEILTLSQRGPEAQSAALRFIAESQKSNPANLQAGILVLARSLLLQGKNQEALSALESLSDPELQSQSLFWKGLALSRLGQLRLARELLHSKAAAGFSSNEKLRIEANWLIDLKDWKQVHQLLSPAFDQSGQDLSLALIWADNLAKVRGDEAMLTAYRQLNARFPLRHEPMNALGYWLADKGVSLDEAGEWLEKAISIAGHSYDVQDSYGWWLFKTGRHEEALIWLYRSYDQRRDPEVAAHLGEVLWQLNRLEEARQIWQDALESMPGDPILSETMRRLEASPPKDSLAPPWTASGRLALKAQPPGGQAESMILQFEWNSQGRSGQLRLATALGTTMAQVQWNEDGVSLERGNSTERFSDPQEAMKSLTGESLPLGSMPWWLQGKPDPSQPHRVMPQGFSQSDWTIEGSGADKQMLWRRQQPYPVEVRWRFD